MKPRAGFWSVGFAFDGEHRAELMAHGLDEQTIACVQGAIDYVKSYSATNPPSRKERRELPAQAHKRLAAAAETLALLDPETVDSIEALAYPQAKSVPLPKLKVLLDAYAAAAGQLAEFAAKTPQRGPDATKDTHIVVMIGAALRSSGVRLDDCRLAARSSVATKPRGGARYAITKTCAMMCAARCKYSMEKAGKFHAKTCLTQPKLLSCNTFLLRRYSSVNPTTRDYNMRLLSWDDLPTYGIRDLADDGLPQDEGRQAPGRRTIRPKPDRLGRVGNPTYIADLIAARDGITASPQIEAGARARAAVKSRYAEPREVAGAVAQNRTAALATRRLKRFWEAERHSDSPNRHPLQSATRLPWRARSGPTPWPTRSGARSRRAAIERC